MKMAAILNVLGIILVALGTIMLTPISVALLTGEYASILPFGQINTLINKYNPCQHLESVVKQVRARGRYFSSINKICVWPME